MRSFILAFVILSIQAYLCHAACTTCTSTTINPFETSTFSISSLAADTIQSYKVEDVYVGDTFYMDTCSVNLTAATNTRANTEVFIGTSGCGSDLLLSQDEGNCDGSNQGEVVRYVATVGGDLWFSLDEVSCTEGIFGTVSLFWLNVRSATITASATDSVSVTGTVTVTNSVTNSYSNSITNSWSITTSITNSWSITTTDTDPSFCGTSLEECDNSETDGNCCNDNCLYRKKHVICAAKTVNSNCWSNRRCNGLGVCRPSRVNAGSPCGIPANNKVCNRAGSCVDRD